MLARSLGVLGDPVHHSKSPDMHAAALALLGLPHHYGAFHVRPQGLKAALDGARALGFLGLNLTIPHKVAALSYVDELDPGAQRIGAVNTIEFRDGRMIGHNTDAPGFVRGWKELGQRAPASLLLLGSGGAAKAVADGVAQAWPDCKIHWVSRRPAAIDVPPHLVSCVTRRSYQELADADWAKACCLWVNATSVGLEHGPVDFPCPLPMRLLSADHSVVDIVYAERETALVSAARAQGAQTQDGRSMLLWQGILALEIWLNQEISSAAIEAMRAVLFGRVLDCNP